MTKATKTARKKTKQQVTLLEEFVKHCKENGVLIDKRTFESFLKK